MILIIQSSNVFTVQIFRLQNQTNPRLILHLSRSKYQICCSYWHTALIKPSSPNNVFIPVRATGWDAFIPVQQAWALTEKTVMAMFIVRVLNRQHMVWAAVSGAKFVPLCSFQGYLWLAPCWLVVLLADKRVSVCHRLINPAAVCNDDPQQSIRWWPCDDSRAVIR